MKKLTDREKVNLWLDSIGETDEECRKEVLTQCATDKEARMYYVQRHNETAQSVDGTA